MSPRKQSSSRIHYVLTGVVILIAAGLRIYSLDLSSYWIDEMVSVYFAKHPSLLSVFWDNNPPLYHSLLKIWVAIFGDTEQATRMLSVLFSTATTAVMIRIGYEWKNWNLGILLGVFHAISVLSILYAQETRMYAMFEFATALNLLFFLRMLDSSKHILGFVYSSVFMAFSHYLAVIPLGIEFLFLLYLRRDFFIKNKNFVALLLLPALVHVVSYLNFFKWEGLKWQKLKFTVEPLAYLPIEVLTELGNRSPFYGAVAIFLLGFAVWLALKNEKKRTHRICLLILIVSPLILMSIGTLFAKRSMFMARYYIYMIPPLLVILATSLYELQKRKGAFVFALLFVIGGTGTILHKVYTPYKEPWREVANVVKKYPNGLILTTRTIAIQTPYFEPLGMEVKKWDPSSSEGLAYLANEVRKRKRVWIIENFWGGYPYMPGLGDLLKKSFHISELSLKTDFSIPIFVMLVERKD